MSRSVLLLLVALLGLSACSESSKRDSDQPMTTVDYVDPVRYQGLWYEIARLPNFFQEDCIDATAEYQVVDEVTISVINSCKSKEDRSEIDQAKGSGKIVDTQTNAKLKIRLDRFPGNVFAGDYWVIFLADDYSWSVVSEPEGRYLWILSRTNNMGDETYNHILQLLEDDGFDVSLLIKDPVVD